MLLRYCAGAGDFLTYTQRDLLGQYLQAMQKSRARKYEIAIPAK